MTTAASSSFTPTTDSSDKRDVRGLVGVKSPVPSNLANWWSAGADIQLSPVSCIDVYHTLVLQGKPMQLLPTETPAGTYRSGSALLTRHEAERLGFRCRKVATETSIPDGSNQGKVAPYKLYVACGFVSYEIGGTTRRMPILLVPAVIGRLRGRGSNYAIGYQKGAPLRLNPHIADICEAHAAPSLKPFTDKSDLRHYLRTIHSKFHKTLDCTVSANTGIVYVANSAIISEAQIHDLELHRTRHGINFKPLPATPDAFNAQLAIRMLRFIKQEELTSALQNFTGAQNTSLPVPDALPALDDDTQENFYNCASWLIDVGLGHWQLKNIKKLPARVQRMLGNVNALLSDEGFLRHIRPEYRTVDILTRLNRSKEKINNSPNEMAHHATSQHAYATTRVMLQKAKIQASSVEHELALINDTYNMDLLPSSTVLQQLVDTILQRDDESQLSNPNYFRARRRLSEILETHNGAITDNDLQQLDTLSKKLKFIEQFSEDPYYKRYFGSLFNGIHTNWQRLDSVVNYTETLSRNMGSPLFVAQVVDHWASFQRDFNNIDSKLESAASSALKLTTLIPMFINDDTRLEHATRTAEKFHHRVNQWQMYLHKHLADTNLTPVQLLSNVELADYTNPEVTLPQYEFDERIYQHIVSSGLSDKEVAETSEWLLNAIERMRIDIPTIRRFLDKESDLERQLISA